jgi:hypothetical protein
MGATDARVPLVHLALQAIDGRSQLPAMDVSLDQLLDQVGCDRTELLTEATKLLFLDRLETVKSR